MQIKDVAQRTGLSIKTIRFYEERGLICPKLEYRNGKNFRDYQEADIRQLQMVAVLRKCLFSIDQIKTMIDHPELTPDVFTEYRIAVMTQRDLLTLLADKAESMDPESLSGPEVLARRLTTTAAPLPLPTTDMAPHFGKFDPETPEQRQAAYLKWQKRYKYRHLRRWLPVGLSALVLLIITAIHVTDHMNFNIEQVIYTKATLEEMEFQSAVTAEDYEWGKSAKREFYEDTVYGLYTTADVLLPIPDSLPAKTSEARNTAPEIIAANALAAQFGIDIPEQGNLQKAMEHWVQQGEALAYRGVDIRSNISVQTMACAVPVEIGGENYRLVLFFRQSPILYTFRELAVLYLTVIFIWGIWFAVSTSKGYNFRVIFLRQYVGRGCWNDAIIHIDEESGESTVLTKGSTGSSNLVNTLHQKKD